MKNKQLFLIILIILVGFVTMCSCNTDYEDQKTKLEIKQLELNYLQNLQTYKNGLNYSKSIAELDSIIKKEENKILK